MKQILKSELSSFLKKNKLARVSKEFLQEMAVGVLNNDFAKSINNKTGSFNKSIEIIDVISKSKDSLDKSIQHEKVILVTEDFIEKSKSGVYTDTPENRKLGRVGQKFGNEKTEKSEEEKKAEEKKKFKEIFDFHVNDLTKEITKLYDYISYSAALKKYSNVYDKDVINAAYKKSEVIWENEGEE